MLLSQSLRQVRKNQGDVTKRFPFHKSLNKGRKMHLDTTRDFSGIAGKQVKIGCLNKTILMSAIIDRNMTSASMVHVFLCIIRLGTSWIGYKRDFIAADTHVLNLYSQKIPLRGEVFSEDLNLRGIFSHLPTSIEGIFLQLHIWPLLSLSLPCLWHALAGLWWLRVVELYVFWWDLNCKTQEEMSPWSFIWSSLFLQIQVSAVQPWAHTSDSLLLIYFPQLSFALAILPPPRLLLTEHQAN